ncbi:hypothetical protein N7509_013759 [Penicillium cosmopolitanum]|uniref:Uncharacterized protein n=1 Tax=Penicillium cosmopolitanum TaxID=1131564 RepID=A0A9W9SII4_9EURO|nr:uncharacterized protein N7509_013759 [Penicillium cosmopolitanum]KAJ5376873.1 hypothetical protein N7509_013759 [Penicillium cosmopolitanum]
MDNEWKFDRANGTPIPNIENWNATSPNGEPYLIQVSWPLGWPPIERTHECSQVANVIYVVDGNAMFLSATDVVRRNGLGRHNIGTIVVGISYPISDAVYSARRGFDLTPPCESYNPPKDTDGKPYPQPYGGADFLLGFIKKVHSFLFASVFPQVSIRQTAIFGHSYGALFALHALFTAPASFDAYLAASPSIWWNDKFIIQEEREFYAKPDLQHRPLVWMSYGSLEQVPDRQKGESEVDYEKRLRSSSERLMADNCDEIYLCLKASERLGYMRKRVYEAEDHGSVIATSLSGAILCFIENSSHSGDANAEC